jgi:CRISPR-associated protein Cmr3
MNTRFLQPLDVLFLRGNKLFGDPGSYGEALIPPWPSVVAGALRSRMLADAGVDLAAFADGKVTHPTLGTPNAPGAFAVTAFHLARKTKSEQIEPLFAPPADLVLEAQENAPPKARRLNPTPTPNGLLTSYPLPQLPILAQEKERSKPAAGYWLTLAGWQSYLAGQLPNLEQHWIKTTDLWKIDERIGVGLDAAKGSAKEGALFSTQAIAFKENVGFVVRVVEVSENEIPATGSLRFGGDGRAVAIQNADYTLPEPDYAAILQNRRCRLILTSPGIFAQGWLPTGAKQEGQNGESIVFDLHGVRAKLVAAAVSRFETVSGWDLANWQPKPAQRCVPTGSVYWLEQIEADEASLRQLIDAGLWQSPDEDATRRAEGFNRCTLANG